MKLVIWASLFLLSFLSFSTFPISAELDAATFDAIIASVSQNLSDVKLPDFEVGFNRFVFHGKIKLYNVYVSGLETIRRSGDVSMVSNSDGDTKINLKIALGFLRFRGSSKVLFMGIGPRHDFKGSIAYVDAWTKLTLDKAGKLTLNEFKLKDLDDTALKIEGPLLTMDFITNTAIKLILSNFTRSIKWVLERLLTRVISNAVSNQKLINSLLDGN